MLSGTYSSIFLAAPVLVDLKMRDPRYRAHAARVLARRGAGDTGGRRRRAVMAAGKAKADGEPTDDEPASGDATAEDKPGTDRVLAGSAPRPGARPTNRPAARRRSGRGGGGRPGTKRKS
jgi:preprotein translocase subunit SecF